jgi:hypothetical protein
VIIRAPAADWRRDAHAGGGAGEQLGRNVLIFR